MTGVDRDGGEVRTTVKYARGGDVEGPRKSDWSIHRDRLIVAGRSHGMSAREIAMAIGATPRSVKKRAAQVEAFKREVGRG